MLVFLSTDIKLCDGREKKYSSKNHIAGFKGVMSILSLLLLLSGTAMSSIEFAIADGACSGTGVFEPCDDSDAGGLCATSADVGKSWCCRPGTP